MPANLSAIEACAYISSLISQHLNTRVDYNFVPVNLFGTIPFKYHEHRYTIEVAEDGGSLSCCLDCFPSITTYVEDGARIGIDQFVARVLQILMSLVSLKG